VLVFTISIFSVFCFHFLIQGAAIMKQFHIRCRNEPDDFENDIGGESLASCDGEEADGAGVAGRSKTSLNIRNATKPQVRY
jgi:hypothetical protein